MRASIATFLRLQAMLRENVVAVGFARLGGVLKSIMVSPRLAAGALLALLVAAHWLDLAVIEISRTRGFDLYQNMLPRQAPEQYAVLVADIDEASLAAYGQWPWPRTLVAQLVLALREAGALAIGFDVVFAEGDRTSPEFASRFWAGLDDATFGSLQSLPRNDATLAEVIRQSPVVLGQSVATEVPPSDGQRPPPRTSANTIGDVHLYLPRYPSLVRNIADLEEAGQGHAIFSLIAESDGIVRRVPAAMLVADTVVPTLALETLRVATGTRSIDVRAGAYHGINALRVAGIEIPTDTLGRIWVPYARRDSARYLSIRDILTGTVDASVIRGRIVLVGTSATGLFDLRATPLEGAVPGVEVHAQLIEAILAEDYLVRPDWVPATEVLTTLLAGLAMILVIPMLGAFAVMAASLGVVAMLAGGSWHLFVEYGVLFDVVYSVFATLLIIGVLVFGNYFREQTDRLQIRGAFAQYLSPTLVEQLASNPKALELGGETREMTVMFCDIRGFTTISEQHKNDPQELTALVNSLLTPLTQAVLDHGGTIDKYIGDCVMAFWNAPLQEPAHRLRACEAALAMPRALAQTNRQRGDAQQSLAIGIGINTGTVVVGNVGSAMRFDYSVLGDAVNLAARLEGQTKAYGVNIILGEETAAGLGSNAATLELDLIQVKGKSQGVRIFGLIGAAELAASASFERLRDRHEELLRLYRGREWDEAAALARELRQPQPAKDSATESAAAWRQDYYGLMLERIGEYRAAPPPERWDGVYQARFK